MFASISNVGIRSRLLAGFALICLLLAATVGYTVYAMSDISWRVKRVVDLRAPVAITSTQLVGNLYATLSTLRGYLLTGDAQGKQARAAMWTELDQTAITFDRMAENLNSSDNKGIWSEAKTLIAEFR